MRRGVDAPGQDLLVARGQAGAQPARAGDRGRRSRDPRPWPRPRGRCSSGRRPIAGRRVGAVAPARRPAASTAPAAAPLVRSQAASPAPGFLVTVVDSTPGWTRPPSAPRSTGSERAASRPWSTVPGATARTGGAPELVNDHHTTRWRWTCARGEGIALPVSLLVMVFVFGGFIAAGMPIIGAIAVDRRGAGLAARCSPTSSTSTPPSSTSSRCSGSACASTTACSSSAGSARSCAGPRRERPAAADAREEVRRATARTVATGRAHRALLRPHRRRSRWPGCWCSRHRSCKAIGAAGRLRRPRRHARGAHPRAGAVRRRRAPPHAPQGSEAAVGRRRVLPARRAGCSDARCSSSSPSWRCCSPLALPGARAAAHVLGHRAAAGRRHPAGLLRGPRPATTPPLTVPGRHRRRPRLARSRWRRGPRTARRLPGVDRRRPAPPGVRPTWSPWACARPPGPPATRPGPLVTAVRADRPPFPT